MAEMLWFKIAMTSAVIGTSVFLAEYTRLTRGRCWRDAVGLTLVLEALFALGYLVPTTISLFFRLSPAVEQVVTWALICFIGLSGFVLLWRTVVFEQISREGRQLSAEQGPLTSGGGGDGARTAQESTEAGS